MVTVVGLTEPVALIVIVAESVGVVVVGGGVVAGGVVVTGGVLVVGVVGAVGVELEPPPHAAAMVAANTAIPSPIPIVFVICSCS